MKTLTVPEMLDMAKKKNGIRSDRELARRLGLTAVHHYRTKHVIPDDATALKLAELAGLPPEEVLLTCHVLRLRQTKGGEAPARVFLDMLRKIAAGIVLSAAFLLAAPPSEGTASSPVHQEAGKNIHYATLRFRLFLARLARLIASMIATHGASSRPRSILAHACR